MNSRETLEYIDGFIQEILADNRYDMHLRTVKYFNKIRKLIDEVDITDAREEKSSIHPCYHCPDKNIEGFILQEEEASGNWSVLPKESLLNEPDVVISCDASITKNPGGEAAIAFVVRRRGMIPYAQNMLMPTANTINEAEYDAIYHAIEHVRDWPGKFGGMHIHIVSDSQLAIYQLKGQWETNEPRLLRKKRFILKLIGELPDTDTRHKDTEVTLEWKPRNSTNDLKTANNKAQSALGVVPH